MPRTPCFFNEDRFLDSIDLGIYVYFNNCLTICFIFLCMYCFYYIKYDYIIVCKRHAG